MVKNHDSFRIYLSHKKRSGLTLVEMLVVIGVLGLLIGFLLPAVQSARESARRAACQNNLRQIGLAVQSFESTFRSLPSNGWGYRWVADPSRGIGPRQPGGWIFSIATFAEFPVASSQGDEVTQFQARTELMERPFPLFKCPSRASALLSLSNNLVPPFNASFVALVCKTDYAANEGDYITDTGAGPESLKEGDHPSYRWTPTDKATGVIFLRSKIRLSEIFVGTSNCYLLGEKHVNSLHYDDDQDPGYDQSLFSGVDLDLNRWTLSPPVKDGPYLSVREFGSAHANGCSMVMCDGSVRFTNYSIDSKVHRILGCRVLE